MSDVDQQPDIADLIATVRRLDAEVTRLTADRERLIEATTTFLDADSHDGIMLAYEMCRGAVDAAKAGGATDHV